MPCLEPVKPSPSSVVALTETCSTAQPMAAARFSRICRMCGASLGACASTVASKLPSAHERGNVPQQRYAVRALVARVGIRKVLADVTERERTEQGIHDGMREHICVRVTVQTKLKRNVHTADDARSAGDQSVYVVTVSDAHITCPPL